MRFFILSCRLFSLCYCDGIVFPVPSSPPGITSGKCLAVMFFCFFVFIINLHSILQWLLICRSENSWCFKRRGQGLKITRLKALCDFYCTLITPPRNKPDYCLHYFSFFISTNLQLKINSFFNRSSDFQMIDLDQMIKISFFWFREAIKELN